MSTDIYDYVRANIREKLDGEGLYTPEEEFDGYSWESKNFKRTERAFSDVFSGTVVERTKERIRVNNTNSFDPMI